MRPSVAWTWFIVTSLGAGCGGGGDNSPRTTSPQLGPNIPADATLTTVAYTYNGPGGNRVVSGAGAMPSATAVDIPVPGAPKWLLSASRATGETVWVSVLADGRVVGYVVNDSGVSPVAVSPATFAAARQPTLALDDDGLPHLINAVGNQTSPNGSTSAVNLGANVFAYISSSGDLVVSRDGIESSLAVNALPNTRIFVDDQQRLLLLAEPSTRYSHDVLGGDSLANKALLVATQPNLEIIASIAVPAPKVIEGNALLWADLTGDGIREVIATVSDSSVGSALYVYDEQANLIATSAPIGTGFRWHHQLAVAPFQVAGELELAVTRTPHIGGGTEFYRIDGDQLLIDSANLGYTSHGLSTADNIDMGLAGDFDGDSQLELLVPSQDFTRLGAIVHSGAGIVAADWDLAIGGRLTTNLSAVADESGRLAVGVGHSNSALRIWR